MDQAKDLRIMKNKLNSIEKNTSNENLRIIAVTGGKGGVGKSNISINLAIKLSKLGKKVCILDADFGLANIDILLGLKPKFNISHVLSNQKTLSEILINGPSNIKIIPASSGLKHLADLSQENLSIFAKKAKQFGNSFDILIIDTPAGISKNVITFLQASTEVIVIATPEPTSITDAYALIKTLKIENCKSKMKLIMNMCQSANDGVTIGNRLIKICTEFIQIRPELLGIITWDKLVINSIRAQKPFCEFLPNALPSTQIDNIAKKILNAIPSHNNDLGEFFTSIKEFVL